ncbi:ribonuclease-like 3 [Lycodopsis pacificus]
MRIQFVCLLLVLLSASVLSQKAKLKRRYTKFINQHIDKRMSVDKCDDVMRAKINKNNCKNNNTFIQSNTQTVKSICGKKGEPYGDMTKSLQRFDIVVCELKEQTRPNKCHYNGEKLNKKIIIKCEKGFPVHYDGDIDHCEN